MQLIEIKKKQIYTDLFYEYLKQRYIRYIKLHLNVKKITVYNKWLLELDKSINVKTLIDLSLNNINIYHYADHVIILISKTRKYPNTSYLIYDLCNFIDVGNLLHPGCYIYSKGARYIVDNFKELYLQYKLIWEKKFK